MRERGVDRDEAQPLFVGTHGTRLTRFGATHIVQGTIASDVIEAGKTGGATIKSHHNVGLDFGGLQQLNPLESLFKDEIRMIAQALHLPESVYARQPSPGRRLPIATAPGALPAAAPVRSQSATI